MRMGGGMGGGKGKGLERRGRVGKGGGVAMCLPARVGLMRAVLLVEGVVMADVAVARAGVVMAWLLQ